MRSSTLLLAFLLGCSNNPSVSNNPGDDPDAGLPPPPPPPPPLPSQNWCERSIPGPPSELVAALSLSRAHTKARFFGVERDAHKLDRALATALASAPPYDLLSLIQVYASASPGACALEALQPDGAKLSGARVELWGNVAVIRPGTGALVIPTGARAFALDLRDLPSGPELGEALAAAVRVVADRALPLPVVKRRVFYGIPSELPGASASDWRAEVEADTPRALAGQAARAYPLAVITSPRLAPEAARVALALRLERRAWLFGESVLANLAESDWVGIKGNGLMIRTRELWRGSSRVPDEISADARSSDPLALLYDLETRGLPSEVSGTAERPVLEVPLKNTPPPLELPFGPGEARAALITVHGTVELFYPNFEEDDSGRDVTRSKFQARFLERLEAISTSPLDRKALWNELHGLSAFLQDGQSELLNSGSLVFSNYPLSLVSAGNRTVVAATLSANAKLGEILVGINGKLTKDLLKDTEGRYCSFSTPSRAQVCAAQKLLWLDLPEAEFEFTAADGTKLPPVRLPAVSNPSSPEDAFIYRKPSGNTPEGPFYVNLARKAWGGSTALPELIALLKRAPSAIVDLRGIPHPDSLQVLAALLSGETHGFKTLTPVVAAEATRTPQEVTPQLKQLVPADPQPFQGRVAVLIGAETRGDGEALLAFLYDAKRVVPPGRIVFVGEATAGAGGRAAGVLLPGSFGFQFTGASAWIDGEIHSGFAPDDDLSVNLSPEDWRDDETRTPRQRDAVLELAIDELTRPQGRPSVTHQARRKKLATK